jgi:hypothetical protein
VRKWRERLAMDIHEEKKRRWIYHGGEAALLRLKAQRTGKEHDTATTRRGQRRATPTRTTTCDDDEDNDARR